MIKELPIEVDAKAIQHKIEEQQMEWSYSSQTRNSNSTIGDISFALRRLELEAGPARVKDILCVLTTAY